MSELPTGAGTGAAPTPKEQRKMASARDNLLRNLRVTVHNQTETCSECVSIMF
jgi:hypothetical protein